jgi:hypothetical protein
MSWSTTRYRRDAGRFIARVGDGDEAGPTNGRKPAVRPSAIGQDDLAFFGLLAVSAGTAWEELARLGLVQNATFTSPAKRIM